MCTHSTTGQSPYFLMYDREPNMPIDLEYLPTISQYMETSDYATDLAERMQKIWQCAGLKIQYSQEQYKEAYDQKAKEHKFKVDHVLIEDPVVKVGLSHKLAKKFKGPYEVITVWPSNLRLQLIENPEKDPIVIHANRCKKVLGSVNSR